MRKNESINYELLYNQVGKLIGWDFSNLKVDSFGKKWDFYEEVVKRSKKTDVLLDIGTGGGEKVLRIASSVFFLIGIDKSPEMIKTANKNLAKTYLNNVRFFQMDAKKIIFPDRFFNITSCRQAMFFPEELSRVLCDNGVFITQQVSEADKINIKDVFERGQNFGVKDGTAKKQYVKELKQTGFSSLELFEYDVKESYYRPEDLIFLLQNTPIIPDFGKKPKDFELLDKFIKDNQTEKGIVTNSKRYMIIAQKKKNIRQR